MKTDILFEFKGSAYKFSTLADQNFNEYSRAISKEKALTNFKSKARTKLGYVNYAKIYLEGYLFVHYINDIVEKYKVYKDDRMELVETSFNHIPFNMTSSGVKYNGQVISLEQAKYLYLLESESVEETHWYVVYENGERECIDHKFTKYTNTIIYNDEEYFYSSEEGVYFLNAIPFAARIEEVIH